MYISSLRSRWILPLLALLDHELEYQRADLVLESDDHGERPALPHQSPGPCG